VNGRRAQKANVALAKRSLVNIVQSALCILFQWNECLYIFLSMFDG
jgi:hypothetical protein